MYFGILIGLVLVPIISYALNDFDREQIQQRISPVGQVQIQEEPGSAAGVQPELSEKKIEAAKLPGQETYEAHCVVCHRDGVAGAPKFQVEEDWKPRLAKGIDGLTAVAIKGLNAMPPKGTCSECNVADMRAAIQYMVPKK